MSESIKNNKHPLTVAHIMDVRNAPTLLMADITDRYAVAWHPAAEIVPLGTTTCMVMTPVVGNNGKWERVDLFGLVAQCLDGKRISYAAAGAKSGLHHDFLLTPFPGAKGRRIDPQIRGKEQITRTRGARPNGDWLKKALNCWNDLLASVPQFKTRYVRESWEKYVTDIALPVYPDVPTVMAGFKAPPNAPIGNLSEYGKTIWAADEAMLSPTNGWDAGLFSPEDVANPTGMWLCNAEFFETLPDDAELFEDFCALTTRRPDGKLEGKTQVMYRSRAHEEMQLSIPSNGFTYDMDMTGFKPRPALEEAAQQQMEEAMASVS